MTRYTEGFSHFVTSMTAPVASGWSDGRVGLAPTGKAPPYHGAHPKQSFQQARFANAVEETLHGRSIVYQQQAGQMANAQVRGKGGEHRTSAASKSPRKAIPAPMVNLPNRFTSIDSEIPTLGNPQNESHLLQLGISGSDKYV